MKQNNKPWVTKSVQSTIQRKKLAFQQGVASERHAATKDLKIEIFKAKQDYKSVIILAQLGLAWKKLQVPKIQKLALVLVF